MIDIVLVRFKCFKKLRRVRVVRHVVVIVVVRHVVVVVPVVIVVVVVTSLSSSLLLRRYRCCYVVIVVAVMRSIDALADCAEEVSFRRRLFMSIVLVVQC